MTSVQPKELLTAIRIPKTWAGARFYFEKVADRELVGLRAGQRGRRHRRHQRHDRALARRLRRRQCGAAAADRGRGGDQGQVAGRDIAKLAGQSAVRGARPVNYNQFKIPLMANLVTRAVRDATA